MNKVTRLTLFSTLALTLAASFPDSSWAFKQIYHPTHLFIKVSNTDDVEKNPHVKEIKPLFGEYYLVTTHTEKDLHQMTDNLSEQGITWNYDYYRSPQKSENVIKISKHEFMNRSHSNNVLLRIMKKFKKSSNVFNDPRMSLLWGFHHKNGMNIQSTYNTLPRRNPKEVIVAVVDTGVDHTHEDLKDVMWVNENEIPGNGIDDDNNGFIDDIHGINTLVRENDLPTTDTMASHWHGTHVAGTIAATQNNDIGVAGVANNVKIMAIRTVPDNADELDSHIVESFLYARDMGAKVINCSFGKQRNEGGNIVNEAMKEIAKDGVIVVSSAGNDSRQDYWGNQVWANNDTDFKYPASFDSDNMIVVASTTDQGVLSDFSNIGPITVDVAAPGSAIFSTLKDNEYGFASGTSMASPHVSGAVAMLMGYFPSLTIAQIKDILIENVSMEAEIGDKIVSAGRIDLKKAFSAAEKY